MALAIFNLLFPYKQGLLTQVRPVLGRPSQEGYDREGWGYYGEGRRRLGGETSGRAERGDTSEGRTDIGQRDSESRQHGLACRRQRERRALFATELVTALRKAHGISVSAMEQVLAALAVDLTVVMRGHYWADPHLEGAALRVVALVEASVGKGAQGSKEAQMQAIRDIEATDRSGRSHLARGGAAWQPPRRLRPAWGPVGPGLRAGATAAGQRERRAGHDRSGCLGDAGWAWGYR